jgi:flotillin
MAIEGENLAKIKVANSEALRRQREAEAEKMAIASEKVQAVKALEEAYAAEREAEAARAAREKATQYADIVIPGQIDKEKVEIAAEAEAEQTRRIAKGDADAIFVKKDAEARGLFEILTKQAKGFEALVASAGDSPRDAVVLLIADKLQELVELQAKAISNIKIDKVTVWDGGNATDGKNATSGFLSGMYKSVPTLEDIFNMAGMQLPEYLKGKTIEEAKEVIAEKNKTTKKTPPKKEE